MNYSTIIFEKRNNFAIITLNRPDKLNALNFELFSELEDAINQIIFDPDIYALILTGAGDKAFAAGADIVELSKSDVISGKKILRNWFKCNVEIRATSNTRHSCN